MKITREEPEKPKKKMGRPKLKPGEKGKRSFEPKPVTRKRYYKAKRFVEEYLVDFNGMRAYQRCGFGKGNKVADSISAGKLLNTPDVIQLIAEAEDERAKLTKVTQDKIIKELSLIAFANIKNVSEWDGKNFILRSFDELTYDQAAIISDVKLKRNSYGDCDLSFTIPTASEKRTALVDLGKHLGMFWEGTTPVDPIEIAKKIKQATQEMNKRTMPE
jgi:phage terminase small subunit